MPYSAFIRELNKGVKEGIAAYDSTLQPPGCLIYVAGMDQTIFVPAKLFAVENDQLATFLQAQILHGLPAAAHLIVELHDGAFKLQNDGLTSKAIQALP